MRWIAFFIVIFIDSVCVENNTLKITIIENLFKTFIENNLKWETFGSKYVKFLQWFVGLCPLGE